MGFKRAKSTQGNTNCQKNIFEDDQVLGHQPRALRSACTNSLFLKFPKLVLEDSLVSLLSTGTQFVTVDHGDAETLWSNRPIEEAGLGVYWQSLQVSLEALLGGVSRRGAALIAWVAWVNLPSSLDTSRAVGWNTWSSALALDRVFLTFEPKNLSSIRTASATRLRKLISCLGSVRNFCWLTVTPWFSSRNIRHSTVHSGKNVQNFGQA